MGFLVLLTCVFTGFGAYYLSCAFADIPTARTSKMMLLSKKQQGVKSDKLLDVYITRIALFFEKFIKLDKLKRARLQTVLTIAGVEAGPEVYTLKAYITAVLVALCSIPVFVIQPLFAMVVIGLAVTLWFSTYYAAFDFVKKRKKVMETEIPRFALTIAQNLENDRDVLKILSQYKRVAGKAFKQELDQTTADMKTGNYENALIRFESRIGSPLLSDVVRGLIGTLRGDDQRMYFKMICFDMRQIELNNLKKEAAKRPKKIQKYSMMMLICIIIIYLVVLVTEVVESLGVFFG
jgi:energy-coupling factor transporter transmembrane protein EcfT